MSKHKSLLLQLSKNSKADSNPRDIGNIKFDLLRFPEGKTKHAFLICSKCFRPSFVIKQLNSNNKNCLLLRFSFYSQFLVPIFH